MHPKNKKARPEATPPVFSNQLCNMILEHHPQQRKEPISKLYLYPTINKIQSAHLKRTLIQFSPTNFVIPRAVEGPCVCRKLAGCPIFPRPLRKGGKRKSRRAHAIYL